MSKKSKLPEGERELRLSKLQNAIMWVRDSLSPGKHLPIMSHIWFRKDCIMTYCEATGQSVPMDTGFEAAVRGSLLAAMLQDITPKKKEMVKFNFADGKVTVSLRGGKTKAEFPILPRSKFLFDFPDPAGKPTTTIDEKRSTMATALEFAMLGADPFAGVPDAMDVVIYQSGKKTIAMSRNGINFARSILPQRIDGLGDEPILIPHAFCKRLVEMLQDPGLRDQPIHLTPHDEGVLAVMDNGYRLFGTYRKLSEKLDYERVLKDHMGNKPPEYLVVPDSFETFIRRSNALLQEGQSAQRIIYDDFTRVSLKDNELRCRTATPFGRVTDVHTFEGDAYANQRWSFRADVSSLLKILSVPREKGQKLEMAALPDRELMTFRIGDNRLLLVAQRTKPKQV